MTTDYTPARRPVPRPHTMRLGRASFLLLTGATAGALFLGKRVTSNLASGLSFVPGAQSVNGFTIYTITNGYPTFHAEAYRLSLGGKAERPLTMDIAQILRHPATTIVDDYHCVTGWTVPGTRWTGIRLADLLHQAHPHADAHAVLFRSFDGAYTESLTMAQAMDPRVLVAYKINGKPLSAAQGAPLRLVVPGMYGYKYIKWLDGIELVSRPIDGYWERNGYDRDAYIGRSNGL